MEKSYSNALPKKAKFPEVKTVEPTEKFEATVTSCVAGRHNKEKSRQVLEIQHEIASSEIVAINPCNVFENDYLMIQF